MNGIDHVVLWVEDQLRALAFYETVVGLEGVRAAEFRAEQVPFPSVRAGPNSIIDLMPRSAAPLFDSMFGGEGACGNRVSHLCLAMDRAAYGALQRRLTDAAVQMSPTIANSYGARGSAPEAFYFLDLDGNVLEARYYP
ncbi:MAG: VOC family protein [Myxococcaceae bacterium]|nr:VOC family protein [Myxococcaceae bacterium]